MSVEERLTNVYMRGWHAGASGLMGSNTQCDLKRATAYGDGWWVGRAAFLRAKKLAKKKATEIVGS